MLAELFLNASDRWPLAVALGSILTALVLWLYPRQTAQLPRRWQIILPLLRLAVIALLCLSLLKPSIIRPRTQQESGAVLLLVDASASMTIADSERSAAASVALADSLGLLPPGVRARSTPAAQSAIRALRRDLDRLMRAHSDLQYANLSGRQVSRRESEYDNAFRDAYAQADYLADVLRPLASEPQVSTAINALKAAVSPERRISWRGSILEMLAPLEQLLAAKQQQLDDALYAEDALVREIANRLSPRSRFSLAQSAILNPRSGLLGKIPPDIPLYGYSFSGTIAPLPLRAKGQLVSHLITAPRGAQTRLISAINSAIADLDGAPIRAVVVFSDGRSAGEQAGSRMAAGGIPVFTVACGSEAAISDISIADVEMPASAYAGEKVTVKATIKATNVEPGEHAVTFRLGDDSIRRTVTLGRNGSGDVQAVFEPKMPGVSTVEVAVAQLSDEATEQNNQFIRPLKVLQDKVSVMLVSLHPSWEYQYVRNAIARARWAKNTDVLEESQIRALSAEKILQQNVIVLFAVGAEALSPQQIDALHRAVTERGASVILAGGNVENLESFARNPLLADLLPYRPGTSPVRRSWPGDRPAFRIVPDNSAAGVQALRLADDAAESDARWTNLPAVYHYLSLPQLKPNVNQILLVEKESRVPVLVESRLGIGRVLFLGVDESWRWRLHSDERDQDRFWLQLIRYSAEEPYTLLSENLAVDLDRVSIRADEEVRLRARVSGGDTAASPQIEIRSRGRAVRLESAVPSGALQPGRFEARIRDLPEGEYDVIVKAPGQADGLHLPLEVQYGFEEELGDISPDPEALAQISAATGGVSLPLDQADELADQLAPLGQRSTALLEIPLWSSGYLFLFILGCLGVEWSVRKRLGLA